MEHKKFDNFEHFWGEWLKLHTVPGNHWMHVAAATAFVGTAAYAVYSRKWRVLGLSAFLVTTVSSAGHPIFEGSGVLEYCVTHPIWGMRALFRLSRMTLDGTITDEVERLVLRKEAAHPSS